MGADYNVFLEIMRRDFKPSLEELWCDLAKFTHEEKIQGVTWYVTKKLIPMALEMNPYGIDFALLCPKAARTILEEFITEKGKAK